MANFNLDYYSGTDLYSDGDVENEILEIAKSGAGIDHLKEVKFPVLYHLSKVRENIVNWYPFRENASCLEIGSGCGAITGILCERLSRVVSVELSKRRAEINYARHSQLENLEIRVGNFNDMDFGEGFDYVILNGVFEYAMSFTEGEHPYDTFLKNISQFLKPDGILLIAIENRLGLKYFAGAPEDHTDAYYDGLNEYENNDSVRTFSRKEWELMMERCGLSSYRFYYPYPDYKFPKEIFTDESLQEQKYGLPTWNFTKHRMTLFEESKVAASLQREGIAAQFSNSFLIEMSRQPITSDERIIYAKLGTDRAPEFSIITTIQERHGKRVVKKSPATKMAEAHIRNMNSVPVSTGWQPLQGRMEGNQIIYPYIKGKNLGAQAADAAAKGDLGALHELIRKLSGLLEKDGSIEKRGKDLSEDECSAFRHVFGRAAIPEDVSCIRPANIDLILDNIFEQDGMYQVIDCEWILDVPVPAEFILWRAINEIYSNTPELERSCPKQSFLEAYRISDEKSELYWQWATHFAEEYVGANRLWNQQIPVVKITLEEVRQRMRITDRITGSLYVDTGKGFTESEKLVSTMELTDGRFSITFSMNGISGIKALRFDPLEGDPCICRIDRKQTGHSVSAFNAADKGEAGDLFLTTDPIYMVKAENIRDQVTICGTIQVLSMEEALAAADQLLRKGIGNKLKFWR